MMGQDLNNFDKMTQEEKVQAYVAYVVQICSFNKNARTMSWDAWCEASHVAGYAYEEGIPEV